MRKNSLSSNVILLLLLVIAFLLTLLGSGAFLVYQYVLHGAGVEFVFPAYTGDHDKARYMDQTAFRMSEDGLGHSTNIPTQYRHSFADKFIMNSSDETILRFLKSEVGISRHHIDGDVKEFTKNLAKIAFDDGDSPEESQIHDIKFSSSIQNDGRPIMPSNEFHSWDFKIYANTSLSQYDNAEYLFRWRKENTLILMRTQPFNRNLEWNYMWLRKINGWEEGLYQVTAYALPGLEKLASSSFRIDGPTSSLTESEMISSLEFSNSTSTPIQTVSTFSKLDFIFVHFRYSSKIPIQMRFDLLNDGIFLESKSIWLDETRGYFTQPVKVTQKRGHYAVKVYLAGILCEQGQFVFKDT